MYEAKRDPRKETDKTKPAVKKAKWKLRAEEDLSKIPGLNLVVLRLAHVYGPYTGQWLGTQLALARVYQDTEKEMKWLWSAELRTATVHVEDLARACWAAAEWKAKSLSGLTSSKVSQNAVDVFNIVDKGNTSQGDMAAIFRDVFGIETGFQGTLINTFARLNLGHVVDDLNDETLDPWADMQNESGIDAGSAPLTPFMEKELLRDADLSLDGSKFEKTIGFT